MWLSSFRHVSSLARLGTTTLKLRQRPSVQPPKRHLIHSTPPRRARYVRFEPDPQNPFDVRKWNLGTKVVVGGVVIGSGYYLTHLEQVPETGRWRFMDISPAYEAKLAEEALRQTAAEFKDKILPENHPITRHVRRVVAQILEANNLGVLNPQYTKTRSSGPEWGWGNPRGDGNGGKESGDIADGIAKSAQRKEWSVFVVDDPKVVNASACMGTVVVYTGILPICGDENGLASVLSHEIGHVVARHSSETYSSTKVFLALALLLESLGLDIGVSRLAATLLYQLPGSRRNELEADQIGMKIAAKACFNPEAAIQVQTRLANATKRLPVDFLDTHPGDAKRIQALRDQLPTALTIRAESDICGGDEMRGAARAFRDVAGIDGKKMGLGIPDSGAVVTVEGRGSRVVGHRKSGDGGEEEVWM